MEQCSLAGCQGNLRNSYPDKQDLLVKWFMYSNNNLFKEYVGEYGGKITITFDKSVMKKLKLMHHIT